jgi:hypothetical protein
MTRRSSLNLESLEDRVTPATTKALSVVIPPPIKSAAQIKTIIPAPIQVVGGQGMSPALGVIQGGGGSGGSQGGGSGLDGSGAPVGPG